MTAFTELGASPAVVTALAREGIETPFPIQSLVIGDALAGVRSPNPVPFTAAFPASPLGTQLRTVAEMIAARDALRVNRQIFFVATGGFDTHDAQVADQPGLLGNVSRCLAAFHRATVEMGVAASVTAFTQSDFGRTLTSNGDGTDHAWGGNQLVVGGGLQGRRIFGQYPSLAVNPDSGPELNPLDTGRGRFIPTTSCDTFFAELALWMGVAKSQLPLILPNIGNFYSTSSSDPPLGLLV